MIRTFIHGLTNQTDALAAARLGVDGIGFILDDRNERYIEYTLSRQIIQHFPPMTHVFLQPTDYTPAVLEDLVQKLRVSNLLVPVQEYSRDLEGLSARITLTGTADRLLDFVDTVSGRFNLLPKDLLLSMLLEMGKVDLQEWRDINQYHYLYIPCDVLPEYIPLAVNYFKPAVLCFEGTTESHTGLQDYPLIQEYVQAVHSVVERV